MKIKSSYWIALPLSALMSTAAHAAPGSWQDWLHQLWLNLFGQGHHGGGGGNSVPELDGAMGPLAIALLVGIIGIAVERKRRKLSKLQ